MKLAAGMVIFRRSAGIVEYLMMQTSYGEHHWTPPKGHLDEGEDELTAAIRETIEEAGLKIHDDYELVNENFKIEINYLVNSKPKKVTYWLGELKDPNTRIILSDEHQDFKWLSLSDAIEIAKYKEMIHVLNKSHEYVTSKNISN